MEQKNFTIHMKSGQSVDLDMSIFEIDEAKEWLT